MSAGQSPHSIAVSATATTSAAPPPPPLLLLCRHYHCCYPATGTTAAAAASGSLVAEFGPELVSDIVKNMVCLGGPWGCHWLAAKARSFKAGWKCATTELIYESVNGTHGCWHH